MMARAMHQQQLLSNIQVWIDGADQGWKYADGIAGPCVNSATFLENDGDQVAAKKAGIWFVR